MTITRKELITKCYIDFQNEITDEDIKKLFPDLEDLDITDIVIFLEFFQDLSQIKGTIVELARLYGLVVDNVKLDSVLPVIEKFLKQYFEIKKL